MKKILTTTLAAGALISMMGTTTLFANSQTDTIDQKAKAIVSNAKVKADKLVEDAKSKAQMMIEQAKDDAAALKNESAKSIKETTTETKALANEALQKAKEKGHELVEKTKAMPQLVKQGFDDKYVYTKEATNKLYKKSKSKVNDARILGAVKYAFLMSSEIHSMKIDVSVKDGIVELFGKVKNNNEAQEAMQIAISTKGVYSVKAFFLIEE